MPIECDTLTVVEEEGFAWLRNYGTYANPDVNQDLWTYGKIVAQIAKDTYRHAIYIDASLKESSTPKLLDIGDEYEWEKTVKAPSAHPFYQQIVAQRKENGSFIGDTLFQICSNNADQVAVKTPLPYLTSYYIWWRAPEGALKDISWTVTNWGADGYVYVALYDFTDEKYIAECDGWRLLDTDDEWSDTFTISFPVNHLLGLCTFYSYNNEVYRYVIYAWVTRGELVANKAGQRLEAIDKQIPLIVPIPTK